MILSESKENYLDSTENGWRFLDGGLGDGAANMSEDMACLMACEQRLCPPTIRLYGWERPTLTLGYGQEATRLINLDKASQLEIPIIRRPTGGRVLLHDEELTYSLISPNDHPVFSGGLKNSMCVISEILTNSLVDLGCSKDDIRFALPVRSKGQSDPACFALANHFELTCQGKKIIGSAQRRMKYAFLQHGSILLNFNRPLLNSLLFFKNEELSQNSLIGLTQSSISLNEYFRRIVSFQHAYAAFKEGFSKFLNTKLVPGILTQEEIKYRKDWLNNCRIKL
jgi:lipoate-protein ligase A